MYLNTIQASVGARKKAKRVGRGIGCTLGKTCGRGHKDKNLAVAAFIRLVLKADKCLYNADCQKLALLRK